MYVCTVCNDMDSELMHYGTFFPYPPFYLPIPRITIFHVVLETVVRAHEKQNVDSERSQCYHCTPLNPEPSQC